MIVTKIERQKEHRRRYNLFLDDEFAFGLHDETLISSRLRVGDILDPGTIEGIKRREESRLAKDRALRLISTRLRSEHELRLALLAREFTPVAVDYVVSELRTTGLVDDRRFAAAYIRNARLGKPAGTALIFRKLRLKGIDRTVIEESLGENMPASAEQDLAYAAAMRILKRYRTSRKPIPPGKEEQRLEQYLARRGFPRATIRPVLQRLFAPTRDLE